MSYSVNYGTEQRHLCKLEHAAFVTHFHSSPTRETVRFVYLRWRHCAMILVFVFLFNAFAYNRGQYEEREHVFVSQVFS